LLAELAGLTARFGGYRHRLDAAHARVADGSHEWIARPTIDSYHTVWFELHEHLLATLGRTRTDERTPEPAPAPHEEYA
jgi:pyruvate,orthophosphate dikinase